jgi:hypothetical protein
LRAELAPFGVDLLLAFAGLGILAAIGVLPRRASALAGAFGLAYLTGTAVVPLVLTVLLTVGVPLTLETFAVVVLVCIGAGGWRWWRRSEALPPAVPWWRRQWRSWPADGWIVAAFIVLFGAFAVVGLVSAWKLPLNEWDAWSIWARKAQMLTGHDSLVTGFFASPSYSWTHLDYPLQFPVWEALHFRAIGHFETQALLRHVWLLLIAFVWAVAYLLREQVRPLVWAPLLLLVAAAPGVWQQLLTGYADVPMALFACLGAISLALWVSREDGQMLALAAIMLAAAANTKNEGLMTAVVLLFLAWLIALSQGFRLRPILFAAATVLAAILPWRLWIAAHHVEVEIPIAKGLDPAYLLDRTDRVWPAVRGIVHQLADQQRWLHLLPLAALVIVACLLSGVGRRVAGFYLAALVLLTAGFVWTYWIAPYPIDWYLDLSVNRVVTVLMFISLAALVHLSGLLLDSLVRGRRPCPGPGDPVFDRAPTPEPVGRGE